MSDLLKGIMWLAVSIVAVTGMIITGEVEYVVLLVFPFVISFIDSFINEEDTMDKNETIINNLREFIEVLDNQIDALNENLPTSKEECIQKNCTAMAYQKVLWTLEKILRGERYND